MPRDGRTIALADDANNTFLIDRDTGALRELHSRHKFPLCVRLLFSSDGRTLASLSHPIGRVDSEVKLWDVASGAELEGMTENFGYCYELVFSPDGGTLVTIEAVLSNPHPPVRSWSLSKERNRVTLGETIRADELRARLSAEIRVNHSAGGTFRLSDSIAVTAEDDSTLAVRAETGEVWLYTTKGGYCKAVCRLLGSEVVVIPRTDLAVPYTQTVVDEIGRVAIAVTGGRSRSSDPSQWPSRVGAVLRDGRTAAVQEPYPGHPDGNLRLIDVATGRVSDESPWGDLWVGCCFDFTPDRDALLTAGKDAQARLWDFGESRAPTALDGHTKEVWGLAFSPDGRTLASSSDDATIKLWDVASGLERATLGGHRWLVAAVAYSPGGSLLASTGWDGTVRLWNSVSGAANRLPERSSRSRAPLAFSPDGKSLASAGSDRDVRLWDVATKCELRPPLLGHGECVFSLAFAPDGKTLFSGGLDKTIRLWDPKAGRGPATRNVDDEVYSLAISADGQLLAAAHRRGKVELWDVLGQKARPPLRGHTGDVLGIAFSPDGLTLATAGRDHSVRLWDPVTGIELHALKGHVCLSTASHFRPMARSWRRAATTARSSSGELRPD